MVSFSHSCKDLALRAVRILRNEGIWELMSRSIFFLRGVLNPLNYARWISQYEALSAPARREIMADCAGWKTKPLISLIMTVGDVKSPRIESTISSVQRQLYSKWELCIAYDASVPSAIQSTLRRHATREKRIRLEFSHDPAFPSANLNRALSVASGEFIALI